MEHLEEFWLFYLALSFGFNVVLLAFYLFKPNGADLAYEFNEGYAKGINDFKVKAVPVVTEIVDKALMTKDARKAGFTNKPKVTTYFANKWGVTNQTARKRIKALLNEGYIERVGKGRTTAYKLVA